LGSRVTVTKLHDVISNSWDHGSLCNVPPVTTGFPIIGISVHCDETARRDFQFLGSRVTVQRTIYHDEVSSYWDLGSL
jgi:hypothetical protein